MTVYVVTGFDLGWDCVIGVFDADTVSLKTLTERFPEDSYYINKQFVEQNLDSF